MLNGRLLTINCSILEIGPEFKLLSQIEAKFGLNNINAVVDLNYNLSGTSFVFPPQAGSNVDGITPSAKRESRLCLHASSPRSVPPILKTPTEVTISTSPDVGATFEATGHLIPQIDIGLDALDGIASTDVFLNLDASTDFTVSTTSIASAQPCVSASTDLNVGVGAQGSFFDLFNASVGTSLINKKFPLFQVRARRYYPSHFFFFFLFFPSPESRTEMLREGKFEFDGATRHRDVDQSEASS